MSFISSIQSFLPRPENRSRQEIARDLEDEFDFHLEMKARNLMSQAPGLERDEAKDAARRMFGDVEAVKKQCQRIALRERIMLQRVNLVLMIVVMLVVVAVGAQVYITQRYNTLALQAITADLARMKFEAASAERRASGPLASGDASDRVAADASRVLVEGDVAAVGWHSIDMDRGTRLSDLLQELNVRDDQWITYRRNGASGQATPQLVKSYLADSGSMVLRPNDELTIRNDVAIESRRSYYMAQWRSGGETVMYWRAAPPDGSRWHMRVSAGRGQGATLMREGEPREWSLAFTPDGVVVISNESNRQYTQMADWDVVGEQLVLDFSNLRDNPRVPPQPPAQPPLPAMPDIKGRLAFDRTTDDSAFEQSARAKAVGDFVVRLFALADPNDPSDPNLDQKVRGFLDAEEKAADRDYADDPATAGMIKELIAGRRKIFEADAAIQQAATAEEKAKAVSDFLQDVLTSTDATAPSVSVKDVLNHASSRIAEQFADNPQLAAAMRERIAEAQRQLQDQPPGEKKAETAGDQGEVRQDDDQFPKTSPFEEVRWKDQWTPVVRLQQQWYELVSLDGVVAGAIVEHCRQHYGEELARKRFSEDLPQMLIEMNQQPGTTSKLQVKDLRTGSVLAINEAVSSSENREMTRIANHAAEGAGKAYPEWTGTN